MQHLRALLLELPATVSIYLDVRAITLTLAVAGWVPIRAVVELNVADAFRRVGRCIPDSALDRRHGLRALQAADVHGAEPERPEFVDRLAEQIPHYHQRHLIRPGVTGLAQIHSGHGASVDEMRQRLCYDLYYLKHRSIDMDFAILLMTCRKFMEGAR